MRKINLSDSFLEQMNASIADEQSIPNGSDECYMCNGNGYLDTLTGPIQCPCTKRLQNDKKHP